MQCIVKKADICQIKCDIIVVGVFFEKKGLTQPFSGLGNIIDEQLFRAAKEDGFTAKHGTTYLYRVESGSFAKRVLLVGLGYKDDFCLENIRQAIGSAVNVTNSIESKTIYIQPLPFCCNKFLLSDVTRVMTEGACLADYSFDLYKKQNKKKKNDLLLTFILENKRDASQAKKGVELGQRMSEGVIVARNLVNTPAQDMYPEKLVEFAKTLAKENSSIKLRIYDKGALAKMGAGGILGVAQGSEHNPYMVHMIYKPKKQTKKKVVFVGKAVTFDSGGLSLKPAEFMTTMKIDMAGAAAVLGAFSVLDKFSLSCEVHGIFAAVENMPSGKAIRPGDVLSMMNKKTVEVLNTDAEGRLTLADLLVYATKLKPNAILDLATLTGACVVALGEEITGLMSNNDDLAQKVLSSAEQAGEKLWRLPLETNYKKLLKSQVADLANISSGRWGGALTAGLFLQEFVKDVAWAHLDIAGPAYAERDIDSYTKKGATGHGVRTLLTFLQSCF